MHDSICRCSKLGEIVDVVADNIARSATWIAVSMVHQGYSPLALVVITLEWVTLLATQCTLLQANGDHWKSQREKDPKFVQYFFSNNFKNPLGITVSCANAIRMTCQCVIRSRVSLGFSSFHCCCI
jgi:hypothetical protein